MSTTEVMRKALEALELADRCMGGSSDPMLLPRTHRTVELTIPALRAEIERLESNPIAPSTIPALTIDEVAEGAPEFADVPKYGPAYLAGAHWAYTLAAARCGARIIKADTLQELADDARQIGLEY